MSTGYFQPIGDNYLGLQSFAESGEAPGWYQLNTPFRTLTNLGIAPPEGATGFILQATAELKYGFSPSAAAAGTDAALTLPVNGTIVVSGQQAVGQLCILLTGSTAFMVQFYRGDIGPIPLINVPGAGGGIPGEGTVTSVQVSGGTTGFTFVGGPITSAGIITMEGSVAVPLANTLHVTADGDDDTGERGQLTKPFATVAAAVAVAQAGDAVFVWPKATPYEVSQVQINVALSVVLMGSHLVNETIKDMFEVYAHFALTSEGRSSITCSADVVTVAAAAADINVILRVPVIDSAGLAVADSEGCAIDVVADTITTVIGFSGWDRCTVKALITASAFAYDVRRGQVYRHDGIIRSSNIAAVVNAGMFSCYGNMYCSGEGSECVLSIIDNAQVHVYGDVVALNAATGIIINSDAPRVNVYGNVQGDQVGVLNNGIGDVYIAGDITMNGPNGLGVRMAGGTLTVGGRITSAMNRCLEVSGGTVEVLGAITASPESSYGAVLVNGGDVVLHGTVRATFGYTVETNGGRTRTLGEVIADENLAVAVVNGGEVLLDGDAFSNGPIAVRIFGTPGGPGGILRINSVLRAPAGIPLVVGLGNSNLIELYPGVFLDAGGSFSIAQAGAGYVDLRSYGAWANKEKFNLTPMTGTLNLYP